MLKVFSLSEYNQWDQIVRSFKEYNVFYLSGYSRAINNNRDGRPYLIYYEDSNLRAINVIIERDISECSQFNSKIELNKYYDIISPYGYGGFLLDGAREGYKTVEKHYKEFLNEKNYISEFVRFELFSKYWEYFEGIVESRTQNIVRSLDEPLDVIFEDFEHKCRKNIKKADRKGLKIIINNGNAEIDDFYRIYIETMKRNNADKYFYFKKDYFEEINKLSENHIYFNVLYQDKIVSTELVLFDNTNCYSYLGGTDNEYFDLRPNDFVKYEIIKWAKSIGLKRFVLGGGYGKDDGIFRYKRSFAPNGVYDYYIGKRIINNELYNQLVTLRKSEIVEEKINYFPLYRA
ncbi:MAG: lipid II:glycine glycyltransferase FemX [Vulcanibacillus sp.]